MGVLQVGMGALRIDECICLISKIYGTMLRWLLGLPYLDDLLIYSSLLNEHLQHLKIGFQRLEKFGIKIKASKCKTFRRQISYLGRLI